MTASFKVLFKVILLEIFGTKFHGKLFILKQFVFRGGRTGGAGGRPPIFLRISPIFHDIPPQKHCKSENFQCSAPFAPPPHF